MLDRRRLQADDLAGEIAWHEAALARLRRQQRDESDAQLLRAIVLAIGYAVFDVHDLFACLPLHPELAGALSGYTRNTLGRRLMPLTNRECGGLVVQFVERARRGRVYAIVPRHLAASFEDGTGAC